MGLSVTSWGYMCITEMKPLLQAYMQFHGLGCGRRVTLFAENIAEEGCIDGPTDQAHHLPTL
jgi:hypothetical protein